MQITSVLGLLGVLAQHPSLEPPVPGVDGTAYKLYIDAYDRSRSGREGVLEVVKEIAAKTGGLGLAGFEYGVARGLVGVGNAAMYVSHASEVVGEGIRVGAECVVQPVECSSRVRRRRRARENQKKMREAVPESRPTEVSDESSASSFWKSCTPEVRGQLISSKAAMHVAENERRAQEAISRVKFLQSPQALVQQAVELVEDAEKYGKQASGSPVHGYAQTVSSSTANSIVKSLPDSVTSFESFQVKEYEDAAVASAIRIAVLEKELAAAKVPVARESNQKQAPKDSERSRQVPKDSERPKFGRRFPEPKGPTCLTDNYPYKPKPANEGFSRWD